MAKNPFGKIRDVEDPYAIYVGNLRGLEDIEYHVLKTYKLPKNEIGDRYARWFVAGKSDATFGRWEYGDIYAKEIKTYFRLKDCTEEWLEEQVIAT